MAATDSTEPQAPLLRVVNPDATPEEIAALVAIFYAPQTPATPRTAVRASSGWPVTNRLRNGHQLPAVSWRASRLPH